MDNEDLIEAKKLANDHWTWLQTLLEKVYKDAFIHGFKHGTKRKRNRSKIGGK